MRWRWLPVSLALGCGPSAGAGVGDGETGTEMGGSSGEACDAEWTRLWEGYGFRPSAVWSDGETMIAASWTHILGFTDGEWVVQELPTQEWSYIESVWARGWNDVWLLESRSSDGGVLWHWDGVDLSAVLDLTEPDSRVEVVWGLPTGELWVGGGVNCTDWGLEYCDAMLMHFDGDQWMPVPLVGYPGVSSVWGRAVDDLFVGTADGGRARFDGEWNIEYAGMETTLVFGNDSVAYAYDGWQLDRWDDAEGWVELHYDPFVPATSGAIVDGEPWVHLSGGTLYRFDGLEWHFEDDVGVSSAQLTTIDGEVWVPGWDFYDGGPVVYAVEPDASSTLLWSSTHVSKLVQASGTSTEDFVIGRAGSGLGRRDGGEWHWFGRTEDFELQATDMWQVGETTYASVVDVYAYPDAPTVVRIEDGVVEALQFVDPEAPGHSVWASGPDEVWLLAGSPDVHYWDGSTWTSYEWTEEGYPLRIRGAGGHYYISTTEGVYELLNGEWTRIHGDMLMEMTLGGPVSMFGRDATARKLVEYDGTEWTEREFGDDYICSIVARSPDEVYVAVSEQEPVDLYFDPYIELEGSTRVMYYDGVDWTELDAPDIGCALLRDVGDGLVLSGDDDTYVLPCAAGGEGEGTE